MCCSLHWEPTISAAEIWSLTSYSFSTRTTVVSHSSSSKYDSPFWHVCALHHDNSQTELCYYKVFIFRKLNLKCSHVLSLYFVRVPCTVFWETTAECAWPICMTGSALLWRGPLLFALASAQPCPWRSPPLCGSLMTLQTKSIASMRPSASTSL